MHEMKWTVQFSSKAAKQLKKLPEATQKRARALVTDIEHSGPIRGDWSNYSKLGKNRHHCHLTYRYVIVWQIIDQRIQVVEVTYVGSREKAPY